MATQKRFIIKNGLDNNAQTITNVATPVNNTDAATKGYTDLKPDLSSTTPAALGVAAVGTNTTAARSDHVHAAPTTVSGNAGTATSIAGQTTNGVLYQSDSGVTTSTAASTAAGQVLTTTTLGGAPTWVTPSSGAGAGAVTDVVGTAPIVSSGGTTPAISMTAATASVNGYMTSTYASKLDNLVVFTTATNTTTTVLTPTSGFYSITALASALTINGPTGTLSDGGKFTLRIKDNGTARALTWTTTAGNYRIIGTTLPTTTVISKVVYIGCIYNSQDNYWDVVSVAQQG